jgi:HK97 family phage major capsid protein/HK97 family phage prohead protease
MQVERVRGGLRFAGYASVFDHVDRGGDIVRAGAFRRSLARNGRVPLLWQHQPGLQVGRIEHLAEDGRGLQVIGQLSDDEFGRKLGRELEQGRLSGLSFGYRIRVAMQGAATREISDLELVEVSLVKRPMQPLACIHKVAPVTMRVTRPRRSTSEKSMEFKADALQESFAALHGNDGVNELRAEVDELKAKLRSNLVEAGRPHLGTEQKSAAHEGFGDFLRSGESSVEGKSLDNVSSAAGGHAVPREIDEVIDRTLVAISPIRRIANVVKVGSSNYRKLITTGGSPSGWVGFEALRPETATPTFTEIVPASGELYANPAASQHMLDDAMFDVEAWLANEIATEFARAEGMAFVKGTGTNQPLGFLSSPTAATADGARAIGTLQTIGTGVAGAFPASNPQDKLVDLVQSLRQPYRQGAVFVMNSSTAAVIRKMKTADGAFIWQSGMVAGQPSTLLGYPVIEAEDMPDIAANSLSIAFGNFKAGYIITERAETSILRDPYSKKPYVYFYATILLDSLVSGCCVGAPSDTPPQTPDLGLSYLCGASPTGEWAGHAHGLAFWTAAGWRFVDPFDGLTVADRVSGCTWHFRSGQWSLGIVNANELRIAGVKVVGSRQPAIASASGGVTIDSEARAVLAQVLTALRSHGLIAPSE